MSTTSHSHRPHRLCAYSALWCDVMGRPRKLTITADLEWMAVIVPRARWRYSPLVKRAGSIGSSKKLLSPVCMHPKREKATHATSIPLNLPKLPLHAPAPAESR